MSARNHTDSTSGAPVHQGVGRAALEADLSWSAPARAKQLSRTSDDEARRNAVLEAHSKAAFE
jgi:hypothetical protein